MNSVAVFGARRVGHLWNAVPAPGAAASGTGDTCAFTTRGIRPTSNAAPRRVVHRDRGFTLIELLVVIIIIGILAAIAIPVFLNQRKKAVDASLKADVKALANAEETWLVDNPGAQGSQSTAALIDAGFTRRSPGNRIWVALNPTRGGYCIVARNPNDSTGGALDGVTWDSLAGGLQNGGRAIVHSSALPGACGLGNTGGTEITP